MGGSRWSSYGFKLLAFFVLIILLEFQQCSSLNPEGQFLLKFRTRVHSDPYGAFANWNANDDNPCMWFGVHCEDGTVHMLDLYGLSLEGTLAPELGKLSQLRSIVLYKNHFSGAIPKQVAKLSMLEQLDLRFNNLSGTIPAEIGEMQSLRYLLLSGNKFEDHIPPELSKLNLLHGFQCDQNLTSAANGGAARVSRKIGHCVWQSSFNHLNNWNTISTFKGALAHYLNVFQLFKTGKDSSPDNRENYCNDLPCSSEPFADENVHNSVMFVRRRLLEESKNLPALPAPAVPPSGQTTIPIARSSGSFPAVPDAKKTSPPTATISNHPASPAELDPTPSINDKASGFKRTYLWVGIGLGILVIVFVAICCLCQSSNVKPIGPWQTGLSGQLQKAFVSGVPKLNRQELETACEDFSNIISTLPACTIFKGTLSSGVEIAVASPPIERFKDWSERAELIYRKKIETLSRVNHKNFVNLLGYCEENEPFLRMMVYEYAPNGTLFEHLHVKEVEHLDWYARTRVIMGTAYCLQYMHHEINPPVAVPSLNSSDIYLTDDYAAKIADTAFWSDIVASSKVFDDSNHSSHSKHSGFSPSKHSALPHVEPEANVYSFGVMLLEIISGKLPHSEKEGSLLEWATPYLNDKTKINQLVDTTLKGFKNHELEVICEVIIDCTQQNPKLRPTMKDVTLKLRNAINISPDAATPKLSPLWWAELEILSVEAT